MLCHKYDNSCLYLTLPLIYDNDINFPKRDIIAVNNVFSKLEDKVKEFSLVINPIADCTNRHAWGKIRIHVGRIVNFPFQGLVFVRLTLQPWILESKKCCEQKTEFNQSFYLPVANHFFTLKIEVINIHADGWLSTNFKEAILA